MLCPKCGHKCPVHFTTCPLCEKTLNAKGAVDKTQVWLHKVSSIMLLIWMPLFLIGGSIAENVVAVQDFLSAFIWIWLAVSAVMWLVSLVISKLLLQAKIMKVLHIVGVLAAAWGILGVLVGIGWPGGIAAVVGIALIVFSRKFKHKGIYLKENEND